MKIVILLLIPIAASNTFGFIRYLLVGVTGFEGIGSLWRMFPFFIAIVLAYLIAKTRSATLAYLGIAILVGGVFASLGGILAGWRTDSVIAMALGGLWLCVFSLSAYRLPSCYIGERGA